MMIAFALLGGFIAGLLVGVVIGWGKGANSERQELRDAQRKLTGL